MHLNVGRNIDNKIFYQRGKANYTESTKALLNIIHSQTKS